MPSDGQHSQVRSAGTGDASLLENLLDGVSMDDVGLLDSVWKMDNIEFFHAPRKQVQTFHARSCESVVKECIAWAQDNKQLAEFQGSTGRSIQQLAAVRLWTGSPVCYVVAGKIRDRTRTLQSIEPIRLFLKFFYRGLHSLPTRLIYTGKLYRGEQGVRDNWQQVMKSGYVFGFYAPTSFSTDPAVATEFAHESGEHTVYVLEKAVGYRLNEISVYDNEEEVLLEGVTMVRVLGNNDNMKELKKCNEDFYCAECEVHEGIAMLDNSPVRALEREMICEKLEGAETTLNKKDFEFAPLTEESRKRKRKEEGGDDEDSEEVGGEEEEEEDFQNPKSLSLLGQGSFAMTYRVKQLSTGQLFAAKELEKSRLGTSYNVAKFKEEVRLVQALRHRGIVDCLGWYTTKRAFVILMEYMPEGNLAQLMENLKGSTKLGRQVVEQLGKALDYMHRESQARVVHGDLKPENVLVTRDTADGEHVLKLADFGLAYVMSTSQGTQIRPGGTDCYKAPEQVRQHACGTKADMWALGCVLVEAVAGERLRRPLCAPSDDVPEAKERREALVERTRMASSGLGKLAAGLLVVNKHERLAAAAMAELMIVNRYEAVAEAVARGLMPQGHAVNACLPDGFSTTDIEKPAAMHVAAKKGDLEDVKILLEAGAADVRSGDGKTPLHFVAAEGHAEVARVLVGAGTDKETKDKYGGTPLHCAAFEGHAEVARVLLEAGADKEAKEKNGRTPLHVAASIRNADVARVLLEAGADKEAKEKNGLTPLHVAASIRNADVARVLLEAGADTEAKQKIGLTPLHVAALRCHADVARVLLEAGADKEAKDENGDTPLSVAAFLRNADVARVLLEAGADKEAKNKNGDTPLHHASRGNHVEMARILLEAGADKEAKNKNGDTPLYVAALRCHADVARILLEAGADKEAKDENGHTPLHVAALIRNADVARVLLEAGADKEAKNKNGDTPLHHASRGNHVEMARILLEAGADKEAKNKNGRTPLHVAASIRNADVARVLLEAGADTEAKDENGDTPLHCASRGNHVEMARILLEAGADKEAKNKNGRTPLHVAASICNADVARVLLEAGADTEAKDEDGDTPLHCASRKNHVAMARVLLEAGADKEAKNKGGQTPLHLAAKKNHVQVARVLLGAGADKEANDVNMRTPLHSATDKNSAKVAGLLLEAGADKEAKDGDAHTPLDLANANIMASQNIAQMLSNAVPKAPKRKGKK